MFSLALNFLPSASTAGDRFDLFMLTATVIGTLLFIVVIGIGLYWSVIYRRKNRNQPEETPYIAGNYLVEFLSIFAISIWAAVFFIWGWNDYSYILTPKMNEYEINVVGQQWNWQIQYANGRTFTNELVVARGQPTRLVMTSKDVLHSFFIPEFRIKQDTVPGQFTTLHFVPTKTGTFHIFCAEYCGTSHSGMIGKVYVLEPEDFQKWLDGMYTIAKEGESPKEAGSTGVATLSMAEQGALLYKTRSCATCHTVNGDRLVGPTFKGLFGSEQELIGGNKVLADENYIRESIMDPMKKIVKGYVPQMPTYRGLLSDEEINQLIAYIKSLK
jgi:cytochrome c oxidase subunit 2